MLSSPVDEIKNRLDIVQVIGSYIKVSKAGANFRAVCPFHSEKKPSFFISPARQIWHCFGCGKGGDIFGFVKEIEGVEFGDALRILAQKAGVELKPESRELRTERSRLYEICEMATRFFEKQLEGNKMGREAKKYLLDRGITEDSIKNWRLGYSPDAWQGLSDFLVGRGYKRDEIEKAGLVVKNEKGNYFDRFRGRIIFPIFDLNSQIIGFGGRVFGEKAKKEIAKYVNTPNTLLYDKSRLLYGLDRAKVDIRKKNECVLVEGYTDVILLSQAGFSNVVASSGTALTSYQLKILKRYSENLLTAFDMDIAGDSATKRGIDLAQAAGFNIKVLTMPEDSDPADIILKGAEVWEDILKNSKSILDFYFDTTFLRNDSKTAEGKKAISKILLLVMKRIPNEIERSFWTQELAKRLEVKEDDVREELKKIKLNQEFSILEEEEKPVELPQKSRKELLEERLVTLASISKSPENLEFITKEELNSLSPKMREIFTCIKNNLTDGKELEVIGMPPEYADLFNYCVLKAEFEEIEQKDIKPEIKNCLKEIKCMEIKNKLEQISQEIKKAEKEKDAKKINGLTKNFTDIATKLANL